jgi:hypothetical protein
MAVMALAAIWLLVGGPGRWRRRTAAVAGMLAGFATILVLFRAVTGPQPPGSTFSLYLASNVLTGTNADTHGTWNANDEMLFWNTIEQYGTRRSSEVLFGIAWERIQSNPPAFRRLLVEKFRLMWADDLYGAYWSTVEMSGGAAADFFRSHLMVLYVVSQVFYVSILIVALVGCWRLRRRMTLGMSLLLAMVPVFAAVHSVIEVQARYHHPWVVVFLVLAGCGATATTRLPGEADPGRSSSTEMLRRQFSG